MKAGGALVVAVLSAVCAQSATIHLSPDGDDAGDGSPTSPLATLSAAIALAQDGDVIQVADGGYFPTDGEVILSKAVEIVGNDADPSRVVFDGQEQYKFLGISNDGAFVHGITFTRGKGNTTAGLTGYPSYYHGCSFEMSAGTVSNCVVSAGKNTYNGCLSLWGTAKVLESTVSGGEATGNNIGARGGCIQMGGSSVVRGCEISNGKCTQGGGVSVEGTSLLADSVVNGCTARGDGGGGINVQDSGAVVSNCVVFANATQDLGGDGGGARVRNGSVYNTLFYYNSARNAGGVRLEGGKLVNCTVAGNTSLQYAGVWQSGGTITATLVAGEGTEGLYSTKGTISYSCAETLATGTNGNIGMDPWPMLHDPENGDFSLFASSPCIDAGSPSVVWGADDTDVTGSTPRALDGDGDGVAAADIGAVEHDPLSTAVHVGLSARIVSLKAGSPADVAVTPAIDGAFGAVVSVAWDWADGSVETARSVADATHAYDRPGTYAVELSIETTDAGTLVKGASVEIRPLTVYLAPGAVGEFPYDAPEKATGDIAAAFAALGSPTEGVATACFADGTYQAPAERILVSAPVEIAGNDEDPSRVTIDGAVDGANKRPFFQLLNAGAFVHGITFSRGWIGSTAVYKAAQYSIAPLEARQGVISNCVVESCSGDYCGGVVVWDAGKLLDCKVFNCRTLGGNGSNASQGGGIKLYGSGLVSGCVITNCTAVNGGGVGLFGGTLDRSVVYGCSSRTGTGAVGGGGVYVDSGSPVVRNCLVYGNSTPAASGNGGGFYSKSTAMIENCTVVANTSVAAAGVYMTKGTLSNCIVFGAGGYDSENPPLVKAGGSVAYCCSPSLEDGTDGNVSASPLFKDAAVGDYALQRASPCVDAGQNAEWMANAIDLAGNSRIVRHVVDMGCYEARLSQPLVILVR